MDVSVVIPTYNRPDLLKQTLETVVAQTVAPREIIVVDNGTNDDSAAMVDSTFGSAVTVVRVAPEGVQAARNGGIAKASGQWVATLDDDDLWKAGYIENLAQAAADGRANLIYSNFRKFDEQGGSGRKPYPLSNFEMAPPGYWDGVPDPPAGGSWSFVGTFPAERLLQFVAFYPSAMAIQRDLFTCIGGFNTEVRGIKSEDVEFTLRALLKGRLAVLWPALMDYRIHGQNSCAADWVSQAIGRWKIFEYVQARGAHGSEPLRQALQQDLPTRRAKIFDQAWRHGRYAAADEIRPYLSDGDWTRLRRLRLAVQRLPEPLRAAVMSGRGLLSKVRVAR